MIFYQYFIQSLKNFFFTIIFTLNFKYLFYKFRKTQWFTSKMEPQVVSKDNVETTLRIFGSSDFYKIAIFISQFKESPNHIIDFYFKL